MTIKQRAKAALVATRPMNYLPHVFIIRQRVASGKRYPELSDDIAALERCLAEWQSFTAQYDA